MVGALIEMGVNIIWLHLQKMCKNETRDVCMHLVSLVIFAPSKATRAVNTSYWIQWLQRSCCGYHFKPPGCGSGDRVLWHHDISRRWCKCTSFSFKAAVCSFPHVRAAAQWRVLCWWSWFNSLVLPSTEQKENKVFTKAMKLDNSGNWTGVT